MGWEGSGKRRQRAVYTGTKMRHAVAGKRTPSGITCVFFSCLVLSGRRLHEAIESKKALALAAQPTIREERHPYVAEPLPRPDAAVRVR